MSLFPKCFLNKPKELLFRSQRGGASLYALYISLLVGIGSVGYLSNVGNAVRMATSGQVDAKMEITADAALEIAGAQLEEVLVRSAENGGGQGGWDDVFDVKNAVLGVFNNKNKKYKGINIDGAEVEVSLTDLPDQNYDGGELTQEEVDEYAKDNGLKNGQEFVINKEALLEAVVTIGDKKISLTKAVAHQHRYQATFFGVEISGNVVFVLPLSQEMHTLASPYQEYDRLVPDGRGGYTYEPVPESRKLEVKRGKKTYSMVRLKDVVKTEAIAALRDMKEGEDAFAAVIGGGKGRQYVNFKFRRFYQILGEESSHPILGDDYQPLTYDVLPIEDDNRSFLQDTLYNSPTNDARWTQPTTLRALKEFADEEVDFFVVMGDSTVDSTNKDLKEAEDLGYPVYDKNGAVSTFAIQDYVADKVTAKFQRLKQGKWSNAKLVTIYIGGHMQHSHFLRKLAEDNEGKYVRPFAGSTQLLPGASETLGAGPEIIDYGEGK